MHHDTYHVSVEAYHDTYRFVDQEGYTTLLCIMIRIKYQLKYIMIHISLISPTVALVNSDGTRYAMCVVTVAGAITNQVCCTDVTAD